MPKHKAPAGKDASHLFTGFVDPADRLHARQQRAAANASEASRRRTEQLQREKSIPLVEPIPALLNLLYSPLKQERAKGKVQLQGAYQTRTKGKITPAHLLRMWYRINSQELPRMTTISQALALLHDIVGQAYLQGSLENQILTEECFTFDVVNSPTLKVSFRVTFPNHVINVSHQIICSGKNQPLGLFKGFVGALSDMLTNSVAAVDVGNCKERVLEHFLTPQEALAFERRVLSSVSPGSEFKAAVDAVKSGKEATPRYWAFLEHQLRTNEDVLMFLRRNP